MTNLTSIWPNFIVADLNASVAYYVDKLGFEIRYIGPDGGPYFAIVGRENISIMLMAVAPDIKPIPNRTPARICAMGCVHSCGRPGRFVRGI